MFLTRTITRYDVNPDSDNFMRWCSLELTVQERNNRIELSVCGSEGEILDREDALERAKEYWVSFFDSQPEEIILMNRKCGSKCFDSEGAAEYVLLVDGEVHGLDIDREERLIVGNQEKDLVFITESCGQIREELKEWFYDYEFLFKYHCVDFKDTLPENIIDFVDDLKSDLEDKTENDLIESVINDAIELHIEEKRKELKAEIEKQFTA